MNYLAHALPFLDRPYYAAGTCVPDWLAVFDRGTRMRVPAVEPLLRDDDPLTVAVAGGILQHLRDDAKFHDTRAFMETNLALTVLARDALQGESDFRPGFLGHLLVEVLLDATLAAEDPRRLTAFYAALGQVDPPLVHAVVNRAARRPAVHLADFIAEFLRHGVLWDYLEDGKLLGRLGQVMQRVGLAALPAEFAAILPAARRIVAARRVELLDGIPT